MSDSKLLACSKAKVDELCSNTCLRWCCGNSWRVPTKSLFVPWWGWRIFPIEEGQYKDIRLVFSCHVTMASQCASVKCWCYLLAFCLGSLWHESARMLPARMLHIADTHALASFRQAGNTVQDLVDTGLATVVQMPGAFLPDLPKV